MAKLAPILLAEDDGNDAFFLGCALPKAGLSNPLIVAHDGQQAVDMLEVLLRYEDRLVHPLPILLLLDLKMPRLSGFDVLAWRQRRLAFRKIPAVVLTASPQTPDMLKAQELGAAEYCVKPNRFEDLVKLLQDLQTRWLGPKTRSVAPVPFVPSPAAGILAPQLTTPRPGLRPVATTELAF